MQNILVTALEVLFYAGLAYITLTIIGIVWYIINALTKEVNNDPN